MPYFMTVICMWLYALGEQNVRVDVLLSSN